MLATSVTKWNEACGKRLARLISYINHTQNDRQYCYVRDTIEAISGCIFCRRLAGFKFDLRMSVVSFWTANSHPQFVDVQENTAQFLTAVQSQKSCR